MGSLFCPTSITNLKLYKMKNSITKNQEFISKSEVENTLDKFGMNWKVEKKPLQFIDGDETYKTDFFGVFRSDNKKDCFGAFTKQYEIFQNSELAELVLNVADVIGKPITHGVSFKGGRRVAMQLELEPIKVGQDTIKRYATAINSHDGSTSLRWGTTGVTISCDNQFSAMKKSLESSARHTSNMRRLIDVSLRALENLEESDTSLYETFNKMANIEIDDSFAQKVIEKISGIDTKLTRAIAEEKYSTRKINICEKVTRSVAEEMSYKGKTLWGLFSGVTHFSTHKGGSENSRQESKLTGSLQRLDQSIYNQFSNIVAQKSKGLGGKVTADNGLGRVFV